VGQTVDPLHTTMFGGWFIVGTGSMVSVAGIVPLPGQWPLEKTARNWQPLWLGVGVKLYVVLMFPL
jgi:hypothetical protein